MGQVQIYCTLMHCLIRMFSMLFVCYDQRAAGEYFDRNHFMSSAHVIKAGAN
jgi:hypothetical protein